MPDDELPVLPPDQTPSWLARNRKLAILLGIVLVLGMAAVITQWLSTKQPVVQNTNVVAPVTNTVITTDTTPARPTFQRSTIANTSTALPPAYQPPTTQDLKKAISNLNTNQH